MLLASCVIDLQPCYFIFKHLQSHYILIWMAEIQNFFLATSLSLMEFESSCVDTEVNTLLGTYIIEVFHTNL